ncbi:MAG: PHP domain-containing protein [Deltaproteobacteria bacterium]|nr:PHP domain-containing protein [Deltaproteobacteria bacterium]
MGENGDISLRVLLADLHIHTCLSPCATLDMTPCKIVKAALKKRLDIIGITDHNSAENTAAVMAAARGTGLTVIPGMEITTSEEVHIIGLFEDIDGALAMQTLVYDRLQPGENDEDLFGMQVVANEFDEVEGMNTRLLIGATRMHIDQVIDGIHHMKGLAVAAHIDREAFSVLGQLGFIPEYLNLDALEISRRMTLGQGRRLFSHIEGFPFITSSDAHDLEDIGTRPTAFRMAGSELPELGYALKGTGGRGIEY